MKSKTPRIAFVVQRYGTEIIGGAESHTRILAEEISRRLAFEVEIFTTTALDYKDWAHHYKSGTTTINGIRVNRFKPLIKRSPLFPFYHRALMKLNRMSPLLRLNKPLQRILEKLWFVLQGPYVPQLLRQLNRRKAEFDQIILVTYLYYPTICGFKRLADRAILIPLAHDEAPFYFQRTTDLLNQAPKILYNSRPEAQLIKSRLKELPPVFEQCALGFDLKPAHKAKNDLKDDYILFLGRVGKSKKVDQLIDYFKAYKKSYPSNLKLYVAGKREIDSNLSFDQDVLDLGFVEEDAKLELLMGAKAIVNPSDLESLSMIALEAMALKKPLLLNRAAPVFAYYGSQNPSVYCYSDQEEFGTKLDLILSTDWDSPEADKALELSRAWVESQYSWDRILEVFKEALVYRVDPIKKAVQRSVSIKT